MIRDGKSLEQLVRQIEELLLPEGFTVTCNDRVYNDEGVQIAEFDVEVQGQLGSTKIAWLIECRDRPSSGPAPGSWIEQLSGRKQRFGFNKVTAVSTTGFAAGVPQAAAHLGIELRSVENVSADDIVGWMRMREMTQHIRSVKIVDIKFFPSPDEATERIEALRAYLQGQSGDPKILRSVATEQTSTPAEAFHAATIAAGLDPFDGLEENGPSKPLEFTAAYPNDDDHFVIDTASGSVRIREIMFKGEFSLKRKVLPIADVREYKGQEAGRIAQSASFPVEINKEQFAIEFHRLERTGETHVILRKVGGKDSGG